MIADIARQLRDLRIEHRPLAALLPYARNPRTHSRAQIAQLGRSIPEFGWTNPVLVDGANGIIAGHGRVLAARELGLVEVPVIELAHLSEAQKRAYVIADNQLALLAGWDEELLALELGELKALGFDLELTGFSPQELDAWLGAAGARRPGRRRCGARAPGRARHPPGRSVAAGRAPAAVRRCHRRGRPRPAARRRAGGDGVHRPALQRRLRRQRQGQLSRQVAQDPQRRSRRRASARSWRRPAATCCGSATAGSTSACRRSELHTLQRAFTGAGGHWSTFVIWAKNTLHLGPGRLPTAVRADPLRLARRGEAALVRGARPGRRLGCDKPVRNDLHPTMKPVALVERAVRNSSRPDDLVLDPFAGAGSTLIACARAGRRARLVELDPGYCDVICRRWQDWSGEAAVREADGLPFEPATAPEP